MTEDRDSGPKSPFSMLLAPRALPYARNP